MAPLYKHGRGTAGAEALNAQASNGVMGGVRSMANALAHQAVEPAPEIAPGAARRVLIGEGVDVVLLGHL